MSNSMITPITKKSRLSDDILNDNSIEAALKVFETSVNEKLRSTEDQLRDATDRLEARIGEQALIVCLAENRAALSLDPHRYIGYEEKTRELKAMIQEMEEIFRKMGAPISF